MRVRIRQCKQGIRLSYIGFHRPLQSANTSKASITVDVTCMSVSLIGSSGSNVFVALSPSSFCDTFWMSYPFDPNSRDLRRKYDQD